VTVLERDPAEPVGDAEELWENWQRPGVSQFRLLHVMQGRWRHVMAQELPDVLAEVERLGGRLASPIDLLPGEFTGGPQAGDDDLRFVLARRPVVEGAVAAVSARTGGVLVRRGVRAASLLPGPGAVEGVPHVVGVRTGSGEVVEADLVVDAMGRRSPLSDMLSAIGARRPLEERERLGFVYYARHFRITDADATPVVPTLVHVDGMSVLVVPGDGGTFSVAFSCASNDRELRPLRDEQTWEPVLALFPDLTRVRSAAAPITPVQVLTGTEDRHLALVRNGEPIGTGVVAVGDSATRTNPSRGRGTSIGLAQACVLRDVLREVGAGQPDRLVMRFAEACERNPLYRRTLADDRSRMAEIQADIAGTPHPPATPDWWTTRALMALAPEDAGVLRAYLRGFTQILDRGAALDEPGVRATLDERAPRPPRYPSDAPTRAQVLAAIGATDRSRVPMRADL
jgi:2-polyprenyl-6-methoxyphenol hydroxylase-like FAD-dependent oxidoreductase